MANKALGRDLGDLLTRARPARLVERAGEAGPRFGHAARPESAPSEGLSLTPAPAPAPAAMVPPAGSETLPLPLDGSSSTPAAAVASTSEPASTPAPAAAPEAPYVHKPSRSPYVTYPAPSNWRAGERARALNWPVRRVVLWGVDAVLVVVAMVCAFGGFLGEGLGKGLAVAALLVGGVLFWLGSRSTEAASAPATEPKPNPSAAAPVAASADPELALGDATSASPSLLVDPPSPPASKIRVHLTRV